MQLASVGYVLDYSSAYTHLIRFCITGNCVTMNSLHIIYVYVATVKYLCVYLCQIILSQIIVVVIKWLKVIKVMIIVMIL